MRLRALITCGGALALAACSTSGSSDAVASASDVSGETPFASTYSPYPGAATALVGATVFDGAGGRIENGTVLFANGEVVAVGDASLTIPAGYTRLDGTGKFVTPGIIDIHSHLGDYPTPSVEAHSDGNEATDPTTPEVWAEHSVWPQDPGFSRALANGGITSLQILPGSANLMGGRSVTLKNVPARTVQGMKFPGAPYGFKMACGENPKRVYGGRGRMPSTRMGNFAVNRQTWLDAKAYDGKKRDLGKETLKGVLDGEILVHNHCYRADEMALVMDMAKEMGYKVSAFHHAVEAYKIGDLLRENGVQFVAAIGAGDLAAAEAITKRKQAEAPPQAASKPTDDEMLLGEPKARPSRRFFGLGKTDEDSPVQGEGRLSRDNRALLQEALFDLLECKRLLDQVR